MYMGYIKTNVDQKHWLHQSQVKGWDLTFLLFFPRLQLVATCVKYFVKC